MWLLLETDSSASKQLRSQLSAWLSALFTAVWLFAGASARRMQKINSIVESDDAAIMMCKCGEELVFCKHPTCMITDCENCDFQQEVDFKFCEYESDSDHQCRRHQARGPFCKHHAGKYLVTCKDCGMTACELAKCEECGAHFCL